jgi:polyvinyl alcohol dehydrogenase (cytochrome)
VVPSPFGGGDVVSPSPAPDNGSAGLGPVPSRGGPTDWTMFGYDLANTRDNRSESKLSVQTVAGLKKRWTTAVGSGSGGSTSTPIVVGDTVYVCEHPGVLAAYVAHTGMLKWRKPGLGQVRCGTPLVTQDRIYVSVGNALHAFNRTDGSMLWTTQPYGIKLPLTDGSPILAGDKIVVGVGTYEVINAPPYSDKGIIVAFNKDGSQAWKFVPAGTETAGISVWSSPAIDETRGLMFIGTGQAYQEPAGMNSDALLAIEYATGTVKWRNQFHAGDTYTDGNAGSPGMRLDYDIGAAPNLFVVNGVDAVGVGSKGALFRAVERDTGNTIWERDLGNPSALGGVMAVAAVADGRIFVAHRISGGLEGGMSQLRALNVADGTDAWPMPVSMPAFTWGAVTHANGVVYTSIQNGMVFAVDATNGTTLWTTMLANGAAGGPTISSGWLYVPSGYTGLGNNTRGADLNAFSLDGEAGGPSEAGSMDSGAGAAGGAPTGGAAFGKVMDVLSNQHGCIGGFCHGMSGGLDFQAAPADRYTALMGADHQGAPTGDASTTGKCAGKKRVVPGDPAASVLFQKVSGQATCGESMPTTGSGNTPLSAAEIEVVRSWIMNGAPFD